MGKTNGLVGGVTGKIGNVIGYFRRGKFLARAYNPHTTNVNSLGQRKQRARFKAVSNFLAGARSIYNLGFYYAAPSYQRVTMVKDCMDAFTAVTPQNVTVDYSKIKISRPQLEVTLTSAAASTEAGKVAVTNVLPASTFVEELPAEYGDAANLKVMVALYCPSKNAWKRAIADYADAASMEITVDADWSGEKVHAYACIVDYPERVLTEEGMPAMVSETAYAGEVSVA